jgi:hypothetical protein
MTHMKVRILQSIVPAGLFWIYCQSLLFRKGHMGLVNISGFLIAEKAVPESEAISIRTVTSIDAT